MTEFTRLDWDSMAAFHVELLLQVLWNYSTDALLEFFKLRLDRDKFSRDGYDPLPYGLHTLFQNVNNEKQNEFVTAILDWDIGQFDMYWLARLIGLACNQDIKPATLATFRAQIDSGEKERIILIADVLDQIPLGEGFYELAVSIIKKGYEDKDVMAHLHASFVGTTGGARAMGEPFPSHVQHKGLIQLYRERYSASVCVMEFLNQWEKEIDGLFDE